MAYKGNQVAWGNLAPSLQQMIENTGGGNADEVKQWVKDHGIGANTLQMISTDGLFSYPGKPLETGIYFVNGRNDNGNDEMPNKYGEYAVHVNILDNDHVIYMAYEFWSNKVYMRSANPRKQRSEDTGWVEVGNTLNKIETSTDIDFLIDSANGVDSPDRKGDFNSPFKTIEYAFSKLPPIIKHRITIMLSGTFDKRVTIPSYAGTGTIYINSASGSNDGAVMKDTLECRGFSGSITVTNLTFDMKETINSAVYMENVSYLSLMNCKISRNHATGTGKGVLAPRCRIFSTYNCEFVGATTLTAISVGDKTNAFVESIKGNVNIGYNASSFSTIKVVSSDDAMKKVTESKETSFGQVIKV